MNSERIPRQGDIYRHFNNKLYQIVSVATHYQTGESYVVYQALFDDFRNYVRPLDMFISKVDLEKYPSVTQTYIFERVDRSQMLKASDYNNISNTISGIQYSDNDTNIQSNNSIINSNPYNANSIDNISNNNNVDDDILINPLLIEFLDFDTYKKKLEYFQSIIPKLDERLINDICVALDITCNTSSLDDTILHIKDYLYTQARFEVSRY